MKVFITGGSGFVGRALKKRFKIDNVSFIAPTRGEVSLNEHAENLYTDLKDLKHLDFMYSDCDVVVHLAASAHSRNNLDNSVFENDFLSSLDFASSCARVGVKRFILLSSIGVNGFKSSKPFCHSDLPQPNDKYAFYKLLTENGLKKISNETGMEFVIIRPPLVYGADAPGNFGSLTRLIKKNLWLPLGAINNKRSFVSIDNLIDLIITCLEHPAAANQTFLVSDAHDISTTELLILMTRAAGKAPRLIPVPVSILKLLGKFTGKQAIFDRLCGNLQVDITHTKETLGWAPPVTLGEGIRRCFEKV